MRLHCSVDLPEDVPLFVVDPERTEYEWGLGDYALVQWSV